jgi:hypothetical protein
MLSKGRRLQLYNTGADAPDEAVRFHPADVLYVYPNPDGTRKNCRNCALWVEGQDQCFVHAPDVLVSGDMVCGYHVFGSPMTAPPARENIDYVDPDLSGLMLVPNGTSCDTCSFYERHGMTEGICGALKESDSEENPVVEALGCCTKWTLT